MLEFKAYASGSAGNLYTIEDGKTKMIIECGLPIKMIRQRLGFDLSKVDVCLISHSHKDHCMAVKDIMRSGIDCYMSHGTAEACGVSGHRVKILTAKEQVRVGSWAILPFDTQHDCPEPLGFLLANESGEKVLYATDTYYVKYRFNGLKIIAIECNYSLDILQENVANGMVSPALRDRILKSHFSLEHVKEFLQANDLTNVKEIWLLHLSDDNSNAERFKREIQELTGKETYIAPAGP